MSSEWKRVKIEQIGDVKSGKRLPLGHTLSELKTPFPYIRLVDVSEGKIQKSNLKFLTKETRESIKRYVVNTNDVCLAIVGHTIGMVFFADKEWDDVNLTENAARITNFSDVMNPKYLYYYLISPIGQTQILSRKVGSAQGKLPLYNIKSLEIEIPSTKEQKEIASILGALDDRITLLRETNATLEAIAQALFKSWFVDFDPVHAKAQGRQPEGMDEQTAALFPDRFVESELGMVPLGWKLVPFGELINYTIGGDWGIETPDEKHDTRVAIIRGTDIPDLQNNTNNRVPVRYTTQKKLLTRKLQDGDIVLEVSGGSKEQPTGRSLYLTNTILEQFDCPVETASFCRLLRPISKDVGVLLGQHLTYIYAQGKTWEYQNQSTGIANFQTTHFLETELVAMPTNEVLSTYADLAKSIISRSHLTQIQQLADLRDTLLPRLISGQLRLPDVVDHLGEI
jgi:type I restriction enzyme S subunit